MDKEDSQVRIIYAEHVGKQDFRDIPWQIKMDGCDSGMGCFYSAHWVLPSPAPAANAPKKVGHPPHMHQENEVIMLIGSDVNDPYDLGGTVEFCLGKDMKQYTFTRSCTIMIPAGTPHGFYKTRDIYRPFLFISIQEAARRTEKFLWEYLTPEERAGIEHPEKWVDVWPEN